MIVSALALAMGLAQAPQPHRPEHPVLPQFYRPPTYGPNLADVSVSVSVKSVGDSGGSLTMPLPSDYCGQLVIGFRVESDPPEALRAWKWVDRADGLNRYVQLSLAPGSNTSQITYTARIITPGEDVVRTQRKEFASWLEPKQLPQISSLGKRLAEGVDERNELAAKVAMWVAKEKAGIEGTPVRFSGNLQADSFTRASLCAAILRSRGVPARIVEYVPTWAEGVDAAFWLVQYEAEEGDWQPIDPTVGIVEPSRDTLIVQEICSLKDEAAKGYPRGTGPEALSGVHLEAPGAATSRVTLIRSFPWQIGGRLMTGAQSRAAQVAQSAGVGKTEWFDEATFKNVLKGGPTNLALFLSGQPTFPGRG